MFVPSRPLQTLAAILFLASGFIFQLTGAAHAENAVQKQADRASHDRWARSEPPSGHHSSDDDDDDDSDSDHHHQDSVSPGHGGELNGHISIHGW